MGWFHTVCLMQLRVDSRPFTTFDHMILPQYCEASQGRARNVSERGEYMFTYCSQRPQSQQCRGHNQRESEEVVSSGEPRRSGLRSKVTSFLLQTFRFEGSMKRERPKPTPTG
jgi:hypothetical protein